MDVKPGFKPTEVGLIPEDWEIGPLAALCRAISDGTHFTPRYVTQGIPFYSVENVTADNFADTKFISESEHASLVRRCKPERGDILMTRIGSLGATKLLNWDVNASIYVSLALIKVGDRADPGYLYSYSKSGRFVLDVEKRALLNAIPKKINMGDIGAIPVPRPPTRAEQEAIAEALSDADVLIESLERLLFKKRDLRRGAMQELLTGKRRLPGFSGEWHTKRLQDVCVKIQDGTHFSPKMGGNEFLYVTSKNIGPGTLDASTAGRISAAEHRKIYSRCDVVKGDLLLTKDGANTGNAALNNLAEPFSLLSSVAMLRFDCRYHIAEYYLYQALSPNGQQQIKELMSGNAITRLTLAKIRSLRFPVAPVNEQTTLAALFSDLDAEIAGLGAQLAKARDLKRGMMQELLTGRIRLI